MKPDNEYIKSPPKDPFAKKFESVPTTYKPTDTSMITNYMPPPVRPKADQPLDDKSSSDSQKVDSDSDYNKPIEEEEKLAAELLTVSGFIYKKNRHGRWSKKYGQVTNKKFRFYRDKTMH